MGKVVSIMKGRRRNTAVVNGEAGQFPFDDTILLGITELEDTLDADLCKRITYDLMEGEVSEPLVKPMWPFNSSF